jgi:hypothetical protein
VEAPIEGTTMKKFLLVLALMLVTTVSQAYPWRPFHHGYYVHGSSHFVNGFVVGAVTAAVVADVVSQRQSNVVIISGDTYTYINGLAYRVIPTFCSDPYGNTFQCGTHLVPIQ